MLQSEYKPTDNATPSSHQTTTTNSRVINPIQLYICSVVSLPASKQRYRRAKRGPSEGTCSIILLSIKNPVLQSALTQGNQRAKTLGNYGAVEESKNGEYTQWSKKEKVEEQNEGLHQLRHKQPKFLCNILVWSKKARMVESKNVWFVLDRTKTKRRHKL